MVQVKSRRIRRQCEPLLVAPMDQHNAWSEAAPAAPGADTPRRHALFAVMSVALSLFVCLLAAEIVLRFLPVATGMWTLPVNAAQPVFRFSPNHAFLFSRDWNFC